METLLFLVFPYVSLAVFVVGHLYRYIQDPFRWNSRSSQLLDGDGLKYWAALFHWGVILTFVGHAGGLLIPQAWYDAMGIHGDAHMALSYYLGMLFGVPALLGNLFLLWRRAARPRIRAASTANDLATLLLLLLVIGPGVWNVFFGRFYILDTVAPWIQGIVFLHPDPGLMREVPWSYKIHVLGAFALFAYSPFSRLVHVWSAPLTYVLRSPILFRRRPGEAALPRPGA